MVDAYLVDPDVDVVLLGVAEVEEGFVGVCPDGEGLVVDGDMVGGVVGSPAVGEGGVGRRAGEEVVGDDDVEREV